MSLEHRTHDVAVLDGEREHVERWIHDLTDDAIELLLVEAGVRILYTGIEPVVAERDLLVCLGVVESIAGNTEPADSDGSGTGEHDPVTRSSPVVALDTRSPVAETGLESLEHLTSFDDVGITGVVLHLERSFAAAVVHCTLVV